MAIGRTTSFSSVLETFSAGCHLFFPVLVHVLGSLNSKYSPIFLLFLSKNSKPFAATSSLLFLSGLLGTHNFQFRLLSNLNLKFPCFVASCPCRTTLRVSGLLFFLLFKSIYFCSLPNNDNHT